jgi:hypothetical protein
MKGITMHVQGLNSLKWLALILVLMSVAGWNGSMGWANIEAISEIREVTGRLEITSIPETLSVFGEAGFSKYVNVFGVHVFSTQRTPDTKIRHVAGVLAQYLDNNEDGVPDNPLVLSHLLSRDAYLVFPADEQEFDTMDPDIWHRAGFHHGQFQHAAETRPDFLVQYEIRARDGGDYDASLEEVLHLVTQHGYANAYPAVFGEEPGTAIAHCLDQARAGHFQAVPTDGAHYGYPNDAWFHYDDQTCEYGCMITEYVYWALTSILGTQDYPGRAEALRNEWELNTRNLVKARDPDVYALLTDPQYKLPTQAPDGDYRPSALPSTDVPLFSTSDDRADRNRQAEEDQVICVQARVVELEGIGLHKSLMQTAEGQPGPVPVDRVFRLLHDGQAKIASGITLMVANGSTGQTVQQDDESADTETEQDSAKTTKTKNSLEFEASVHTEPSGRIAVEFKFQQTFTEACFTKDDSSKKDVNKDKQLHWASTMHLIPGRPAIAGVIVKSDTAAVLILQAQVAD